MSYKVPFINFGAQYRAHKDEYDEVWFKCNENGKYILQDSVEEFEKNLAEFLGMKYAVGVANGTDALTIALKCKEVDGPLTTTDYTFKATHEAIVHTLHDLKRVDINPETRMPDYPVDIPVHIEGMVSHSPNAIIEDACQAFGAEGVGYSGTACYSFYPAKILGGPGDGGAIVTNDKEVYEKARLYRHHWQTGKDERYGYNSRLDNVMAGFLNVRLKYIKDALKRRKQIAEYYLSELKSLVGLPFNQEGRVWQDFVVTSPNRADLVAFLKDAGIGILGDGMTPNFKAVGSPENLPNTQNLYDTMFRLPCNETLTDTDVEYVVSKIKEYAT